MNADHEALAKSLGLKLHEPTGPAGSYIVTGKDGMSIGWIKRREHDRGELWDPACDFGLNESLGLFRSFDSALMTLSEVRAAFDLIQRCRTNARIGRILD